MKDKAKHKAYQREYQKKYRTENPEKTRYILLKYWKKQLLKSDLYCPMREALNRDEWTLVLEALQAYKSKEPKAAEVISVILSELYPQSEKQL